MYETTATPPPPRSVDHPAVVDQARRRVEDLFRAGFAIGEIPVTDGDVMPDSPG